MIKKMFIILPLIIGFLAILLFFANGNFLTKKETFLSQIKNLIKQNFNINDIELRGEKNNLIKILFLGIAGKPNPTPNLTDTIILLLIQESGDTYNTKIISIPRDLAVYNNDLKNYVKINSFYALYGKNGIDILKNKILEITGLEPDYFVLVDLSVVKEIVDFLGGVNILVDSSIDDNKFPKAEFGYQDFKLPKGWRYIDGNTALNFVRFRHTKEGDFGRIKRQQNLLLAIYNKLQNSNFKNTKILLELYNNIKDKIVTDINIFEDMKFYSIFAKIKRDDISKTYLGFENSLTESHKEIYGGTQDILYPKSGIENYQDVQSLIQNFINQ